MRLLAEFRWLRILNVDWAIVLIEEANSQARIQNKGECDPLLPVHTHCHWPSLAAIVSSSRKQKFPPTKGVSKKKGVTVFSQTWDTLKVKITLYCTTGLHKLWQPCSRAARKWKENEEMKRKWREHEEMKGMWRENEEMERSTLHISSFSLYFPPLYPYPMYI